MDTPLPILGQSPPELYSSLGDVPKQREILTILGRIDYGMFSFIAGPRGPQIYPAGRSCLGPLGNLQNCWRELFTHRFKALPDTLEFMIHTLAGDATGDVDSVLHAARKG
jgi:hypothetical protein